MNRSLLAAPAAVAVLLVFTGGLAVAQETTARSCEVVESELVSAQTNAQLPVTIDGVTYQNLEAVNTALSGLPANLPVVAPLRTKLQAIVDAAAKVDLLKTEKTTCTDETVTPDPTDTPDPTAEPGPTGPAGPSGEPGADGQDGASGPSGEAGPTGPAGQDGDATATETSSPAAGDDNSVNTQNNDNSVNTQNNVTNNGTDTGSSSAPADSVPSGSVDTGWAA